MNSDPFRGPIERVNYATGMMLSAEDFRAEQSYHRSRLNQVLRFALGKGTIAGLAVEGEHKRPNPIVDADYTVYVRAGLAIDGLGQLIEVTRDYSVSLKSWVQTNQELVTKNVVGNNLIFDVMLSARDLGRAKTPSFAEGPFDALDSVTASRLEDGFLLELIPQKAEPDAVVSASASSTKPLEQVMGSWDAIAARKNTENSQILLARIRKCEVTQNPTTGIYSTTSGQLNIAADNDVRPFVFLAGRSLEKFTV